MLRTLWGDDARFLQTYFPAELGGKTYLAGDGALRDPATGYTITGRIDDVLNVSGHRLGTMAVESALVAHPEVAEAAVVGRHDALTGEAIVAFVVPKGGPPDDAAAARISAELRAWIAREIGPIAKPREIRYAGSLPRRAPARSCAACCARSPTTIRSRRTFPRWRIRRRSSSSGGSDRGASVNRDASGKFVRSRQVCQQRRQRRPHGFPDYIQIDIEITVRDTVAHPTHAAPRHIRLGQDEIGVTVHDFRGRLANDDQAHDDGLLGASVRKEIALGHSLYETTGVDRSLADMVR